MWFQNRDELVEGGDIFREVSHIGEVMRISFGLPYDVGYYEDSIVAKNAVEMDKTLDGLATVLNGKLSKEMQGVDKHRFLMHQGVTIRALNGSVDKTHPQNVYMPFTLSLPDGQVVTALVKNSGDKLRQFKPTAELEVHRWAINNRDITSILYPNDDSRENMSISSITSNLASILNRTHARFIKGKKELNRVDDLVAEIAEYDFKPNRVEWINEPETVVTPPIKHEVTMEEEQNEEGINLTELDRAIQNLISKYNENTIEDKKKNPALFSKLSDEVYGLYDTFEASLDEADVEELETWGDDKLVEMMQILEKELM